MEFFVFLVVLALFAKNEGIELVLQGFAFFVCLAIFIALCLV